MIAVTTPKNCGVAAQLLLDIFQGLRQCQINFKSIFYEVIGRNKISRIELEVLLLDNHF
jgi:hypothetical protein